MSRLYPAAHEIVGAFSRFARSPSRTQLDALAAAWIPAWALAGAPDTGEFGIGFGRVEVEGRRFEFAETGIPAMLAIALDEDCRAADIVAWGARRAFLASWLGAVSMLGQQYVAGPRMGDGLPVYPEPFSWLRGERQGVVLVDERRAAVELRDAGPFVAMGGFEHAAQLVALLTPPPPRVLIPDPQEERRAA